LNSIQVDAINSSLFSSRLAQKLQIIDENLWQNVWLKVVEVFGDDAKVFVIYSTTIFSIFVYWSFGAIFFGMNFVSWFGKFRIQQKEKPIKLGDVVKVFVT
jgi:hypothetical protein